VGTMTGIRFALRASTLLDVAVDILVNNAGGLVRMDNPEWHDISALEWIDAYNKNTTASVRLIQCFVPDMKGKGWGRIINISSMAGCHIRGFTLDYTAAKAALNNLTIGFGKALGPYGITVNAIAPGTIMTPAVEQWVVPLRRQYGWSASSRPFFHPASH
jgi:3-oxoacyl-[acyl-carrier protein] reductase